MNGRDYMENSHKQDSIYPFDDPVAEQLGVQQSELPQLETERPAVSYEVAHFYEGHRAAMLSWTKQHGNTNFPIVERGGKLFWVNRKARRANEKGLKQQLREKKKNE